MPTEFDEVFQALRPVLANRAARLRVAADTSSEYTLVTQSPSKFPQHKGQPMWFGQVRIGKAYVSLHLLPLYMNPKLAAALSPALKKRMQGKACFNFKKQPEPELLSELDRLAESGIDHYAAEGWL